MRNFERTGGQKVCIFRHPLHAERTNSAGVWRVYNLLRTRHLSFDGKNFSRITRVSLILINKSLGIIHSLSLISSAQTIGTSQLYMMNRYSHCLIWVRPEMNISYTKI